MVGGNTRARSASLYLLLGSRSEQNNKSKYDVFILTALYRPLWGEMSRSDRGVVKWDESKLDVLQSSANVSSFTMHYALWIVN